MKLYIKLGADKSKLVVGIPTYGRAFTLADAQFNEIEASANGPAKAGKITNEEGFLAFFEVSCIWRFELYQITLFCVLCYTCLCFIQLT